MIILELLAILVMSIAMGTIFAYNPRTLLGRIGHVLLIIVGAYFYISVLLAFMHAL